MFENGQLTDPTSLNISAYTQYPSAYIVLTPDGQYSKHYYSGTQRIVSRIGDQPVEIFHFSGRTATKEGTQNIDDKALQTAQKQDLQKYLDKAAIKATFKETVVIPTKEGTQTEQRAASGGIYYFHPDHLGTTTFLTDANGDAYQFFLNLPFGETMVEQKSILSNFATPYKFTGKELDDETGMYYFGARYYSARESIWWSVDPLAEKYPNESPYMYCGNNPIIYIDPDGREKIVVVGDQEGSPNSDRKNRDNNTGYKYKENSRHFLQAGLDSARKYKKSAGDEMVTMIIYKGQYTSDELKLYQEAGTKSGINVKVISDDADIIDYVNKKSEFAFSSSARDSDLITDFTYVGHGWTKSMLVGGGSIFTSDGITPSDLNTKAFDVNANIFLNSCGSGFGSLFSGMQEKTKGTVTGFNSTVIWGEGGLGTYRGNTQEYYFPWQNRESTARKELPANEVVKTETGTR